MPVIFTVRMKRNNTCKSHGTWHMLDWAEMYSVFTQIFAGTSKASVLILHQGRNGSVMLSSFQQMTPVGKAAVPSSSVTILTIHRLTSVSLGFSFDSLSSTMSQGLTISSFFHLFLNACLPSPYSSQRADLNPF